MFCLDDMFLLPRFHASVKEDLDTLPGLKTEYHTYSMTPKAKRIQICILTCLDACFMELKKLAPEVIEDFFPHSTATSFRDESIIQDVDEIDFYLGLNLSRSPAFPSNFPSIAKIHQLLSEMKILRSLLL